MLLDGGRAPRGLASTSVASKAAPREMASSAARRATQTSRVGAVRGAEAVGDAGLREVCPLVAGRGAAGGGADARASAVRLGRAKRADDGRAGSAAAACSVTAGVAGVVARCAQSGRGVSGASAAAPAALATAVAAAVAVAAAAVAAAAVAWAAMCDCHADAVLGGVLQARGAAVVVASAAVPRGAKRSPTPSSACVPKSRGIGDFGWASKPDYSHLPWRPERLSGSSRGTEPWRSPGGRRASPNRPGQRAVAVPRRLFLHVAAPWRGRGSVQRVQTRAPPRRAWRRWGREWGKSWGQVGGESGSDGGREGDLLAASIRAGAGATFKWCLVAQHLLSVGFSAQRECEVLLVERRHRVPHRLVRHLKLGALCLALLCAANRRHVRPPLARERILRSVLRLTLHDLEQPLLRRAARRGAGPVQSGGRVGAGWVQGGSRIGPEAR